MPLPLRLLVTAPDGTERRLPVDTREISVGTAEDAQLQLGGPGVSPRHARFVFKDGKVILADLKSAQGTFVNGTRLDRPRVLVLQDHVRIGDNTLYLEEVQPVPMEFQPWAVRVTNGTGTEQVLVQKKNRVLVGQAKACDLRLTGPGVGANHMLMVCLEGLFYMADLGGPTGTRINGEPLLGARNVGLQDVVTLGSYTLRLCHPDVLPAPGPDRKPPSDDLDNAVLDAEGRKPVG